MAKLKESGTHAADVPFSRRQLLVRGAVLSAGMALPGARSVLAQGSSEPFRFGLIKALTGRVASAYAPLYVGARIALEEINASGGILGRKVEIIEDDDEGTPAKEPAVVRALQEKKIDILLGPVGTSPTLTALSVTTPAKLIQTGGSFAEEAADGKSYPYHFQFNFNSKLSSGLTVDYIAANFKDKKIGIIQESFAASEAISKAVIAGLKEKGISPVGYQVFPGNTPDIKSYLRTLQRADTEVLIVSTGIPSNSALVFNALRGIDWYPPIYGYSGLMSDALLDILPPEALARVNVAYLKAFSYYGSKSPPERQVAYVKKMLTYPEAKGQEPNAAVSPFYDAMYAYQWAIENAKSTDPDKVKASMETLKGFAGMAGTLSLTAENHCALGPDSLTFCKLASAKDPRAMGAFRERIAD
jgi:ABC-type branched-subunit amino acid transport system substrate-binding protein